MHQIGRGHRLRLPAADGLAQLLLHRPVDHALQIGAGEVFRHPGQPRIVDACRGLVGQLDAQDGLTGRAIRRRDEEDAVEAAWTPQRRVHVPGRVGRGQDEHALVGAVEAVELGEKLVDDLAARTVAHVGAIGAQRVHLVEEEHAGRLLTGHLEERVEIALALSDVHIQHVVEAHGEETGLHLTGGGPRQVRLAAAGRPVHEDAAAGPLAVGLVELGMAERVDDLHADLFLQRRHPADVVESERRALDPARILSRFFFCDDEGKRVVLGGRLRHLHGRHRQRGF